MIVLLDKRKIKYVPVACTSPLVIVSFRMEKVYITPSTMGDGLHNPPTYETVYITPWTLKNRSN